MNVKLLIALLCCILLAGLVSAESESMPAEQLTEQVKIEDEQAEAKKKQDEREKIEKEIRDKVEAEIQSEIETLKAEVKKRQDEREKIEKEIRDKVEAEFRSEIEALKKEKQELEGQLQNALTVAKYVGYSAIGIVLVIFFGLIITRRKSSDGVNFEARIIDSVTDLLKRKMPNLSGDLKRQISDIIKHNAVPGPSFSSFARAEYNIKKIDENNVSLTVNVLYIVSPSDVAKLTSESIICWDDLPKEIRNDFIQNRKTEQLYLLYKKKIMTIYDKPITDSSIPEGKPKNNAAQEKEAEPVMAFIPRKPQYTLTQVILPDDVAMQVKNLLKLADPTFRKMLYEDWELRKIDPSGENTAFLFYGLPGTGKTMCVEAFADALGKQIIDVSYSQIESKYVGETGKNIVAAFEAAEKSGAVLFFDEADSILGSRMSNVTQAADQAVNVARAVMLKELDAFNGIVAFATNFAKNIDSAFVRRIDKHIEIPLPTDKARLVMFQKMISDRVPGKNRLDWNKLVAESEGFAGGDVKNVVVNSLVRVASEPEKQRIAATEVFVEEIGLVRKAKQNVGKMPAVVTERVMPIEEAKKEIQEKGQ